MLSTLSIDADRGCRIKEISQKISFESGEVVEKNAKKIMQNEAGILRLITDKEFAMDKFSELPKLGRFILLKQGNIIGAGLILDIYN